MRRYKFILMAVATLFASVALTSCDGDNKDEPQLPADKSGVCKTYILNEGSWGGNNAGIAMFAPNADAAFVSDIYFAKNNAKLGDLANDMIEDDGSVYVLLNGSKYVARLDSDCIEKARYTVPESEGTPRWMDEDDGYLYVSQYGGKVVKLNALTLAKVGEYNGGNNLEGLVVEDGNLYVANAYKVDGSGNYVYNTEVHVVNTHTMKQSATIEVVANPERIVEAHDEIYVMSKGNYVEISPSMQVLDVKNGKSTHITNADKITEGNNGLLYGIRSAYDANWNLQNEFFTYNPATGAVSLQSFLKDAPAIFSTIAIYLLEVDEKNGDIYVGTSDYVTTGTIYRFDRNGNLKQTFDSGGVNPKSMIFID